MKEEAENDLRCLREKFEEFPIGNNISKTCILGKKGSNFKMCIRFKLNYLLLQHMFLNKKKIMNAKKF